MSALSLPASHRNYFSQSLKKDQLIEWLKGMLFHSFVLGNTLESYLDTCSYFEELVEEHRKSPTASRLRMFVPTVGVFHTKLPMRQAFELYDRKYAISSRRMVAPSFNEIRHILNIAQIVALGKSLRFVSFDGDQTLYSDGGNFEDKEELAYEIIELIRAGVYVAVITAAGYGLDGSKYEVRLQGLLRRFVVAGLSAEHIAQFFVVGGECNYLLQCQLVVGGAGAGTGAEAGAGIAAARLIPVPIEVWQAAHIPGPKPSQWHPDQVTQVLDIAEASMKATRQELRLRARILRKDRAVGMFPGGADMAEEFPLGHGSIKLKREALDEVVLRAMDALRRAQPAIQLPFCAFNGGRDAWLDVGNKRIGVEALSSFLGVPAASCLHVGDQFLHTGNDLAARQVCPCIWIAGPHETLKVLEHVLKHCLGISPAGAPLAESPPKMLADRARERESSVFYGAAGESASVTVSVSVSGGSGDGSERASPRFNVYTGGSEEG